MLEKMAFILDAGSKPPINKPTIVDQIEEAKKARYLEQVSKIQHLKVTSQESKKVIA